MKNVRVQKLRFPGRDPGSGRYREVREAHRNRFHLFSSRLTRGARSYYQKTEKVNDYQINDYFNVSVQRLYVQGRNIVVLHRGYLTRGLRRALFGGMNRDSNKDVY